MSNPIEPFDRTARRRARDRAAADFARFAFLKEALAADLAERLSELGPSFPRILDLGSHDGRIAALLPDSEIVAADAGFRFAEMAHGVMCDEDRLPFAAGSFDAVLSAASLHGVNDLPGALVQIRHALKPGGVFLASFVGGASLAALRARLLAAEMTRHDGASPRFLPMVDPREAPGLLQRAGFIEPVVDVHQQTVRYRGAASMLADLRGMGESNVLHARSRKPISRADAAALCAAAETEGEVDGRHPVPLEIVTMTGRAPPLR
ncbi:class I SAM-dependent methyltransferase [Sphingosinicella microcystinivorans]|uniref:Methyltransferase family protein n=1 Tax=Sphingosinicella microcystinivorans TaxID=335406 RepID=A0AAD1D653_SPHMI|nr:class I SAM-dependent methyltransferase [Sphingosinicella microcystinivorans]RKS90627.1 methyltransferase family protein [Sphingosinicella microcystinivorans]BBE33541.1 SAM-dependent methyltransferase [Sphingosinicella microcystinivorans]